MYVYVYIYIYIYIYIHIYTYIQTYIHTYIHACMHTYIHTYIHTYMSLYIHIWPQKLDCVATFRLEPTRPNQAAPERRIPPRSASAPPLRAICMYIYIYMCLYTHTY